MLAWHLREKTPDPAGIACAWRGKRAPKRDHHANRGRDLSRRFSRHDATPAPSDQADGKVCCSPEARDLREDRWHISIGGPNVASEAPTVDIIAERRQEPRVFAVIVKAKEEFMETSKQSTGTNDTSTPWLDDIKKLIEKFQLPGIDVAALVDWQRKDLETLVEANRQAYEGVRALIERRNEILQETLAQWQAAVKDATSSEAIAKQAEARAYNR